MRLVRAYTFQSEMSLPQILATSRELTAWQWYERDSDRLGEYISARALPDMVKLFIEGDEADVDAVCQTVFTVLLPAANATDIAETDPIE